MVRATGTVLSRNPEPRAGRERAAFRAHTEPLSRGGGKRSQTVNIISQ